MSIPVGHCVKNKAAHRISRWKGYRTKGPPQGELRPAKNHQALGAVTTSAINFPNRIPIEMLLQYNPQSFHLGITTVRKTEASPRIWLTMLTIYWQRLFHLSAYQSWSQQPLKGDFVNIQWNSISGPVVLAKWWTLFIMFSMLCPWWNQGANIVDIQPRGWVLNNWTTFLWMWFQMLTIRFPSLLVCI